MSYIAITLNHFRAIQSWADAHDADAKLDMRTFELEVKARNRYYKLHPRFIGRMDGRLVHVPHLVKEAHGFIGWLPYRQARWALAADKLAFKDFLTANGLPTPARAAAGSTPDFDYLLKRSVGSFGYELYGPYRAGQPALPPPSAPGDRGELFAEQFVHGLNVKAWFWGATPIYAHLDPYPTLAGNGASSIAELLSSSQAALGVTLDGRDMEGVISFLAYQGLTVDDVLPGDHQVSVDYRYGRTFAPMGASAAARSEADNRLDTLGAEAREQLRAIGERVAAELRREFPAPVLCSIDGVMDASGKIWWLEMNSNPIFPPDGYAVMLGDLFGLPRT